MTDDFLISLKAGLLAVGLAALSGCGVGELPGTVSRNIGTGQVVSLVGLEGRWAGPVTSADPTCGETRTGLMSVGEGAFAFDPFQSSEVIKGTVGNGGHLSGVLTRAGGGKEALKITFEGTAAEGGDAINGTLLSGHCRWSVALRRA